MAGVDPLGFGESGLEKYLLVALGGALGSMARFWLGSAIANRVGAKLPYGTFLINMLACAAIGFSLTFLATHAGLSPAWRFVLPIGFIGAFSTFSTYQWETFSNLRNGALLLAIGYAVGSLVLGFAAVWGGAALAGGLR